MNRDGHKGVVFFVGPEVEHSPAFSKRTLFVVGTPSLEEILKQAKDNRVTHVFMGANHSFSADQTNTTPYWDNTITALLDCSFWVTLDYQAHEHKLVLQMLNAGIWQSRLFVPLLSVRIPKIETSSPNLTVKIDDVDFNTTNRGVWCFHFHEMQFGSCRGIGRIFPIGYDINLGTFGLVVAVKNAESLRFQPFTGQVLAQFANLVVLCHDLIEN